MSQLILIWSLCGLKTLQNVGDFPMYPIFSFKWFDSSQNASNFDFRCVWCLNPFESKFWCTHLSWSHQGSNYLLHTKSFDERPFETISKLSVSEFWRNYVADAVLKEALGLRNSSQVDQKNKNALWTWNDFQWVDRRSSNSIECRKRDQIHSLLWAIWNLWIWSHWNMDDFLINQWDW